MRSSHFLNRKQTRIPGPIFYAKALLYFLFFFIFRLFSAMTACRRPSRKRKNFCAEFEANGIPDCRCAKANLWKHSFWAALGAMVSHCGQSWPRWRLILGSLGRDGVSIWAVLGAMASHSGQFWAQWRRILGSLARNGVSFWAVLGAMASYSGQSWAQ